MIGIYKLIFDLSLYYTLTGFYMDLFYHASPSIIALGLLCLVVVLERLLQHHGKKAPALLVLPLAVLLFRPETAQVVQMVPAWGYVGWCVKTGRMHVKYDQFRDHFKLGLGLLMVLVPGFLINKEAGASFAAVVPYLVLMLACGVSLLRLLRENASGGFKHMLPLAAILAICGLLTAAQVPQLVMAGFSYLYNNVILRLLEGLVWLFVMLLYGLYYGFGWLSALFGRQPQEQTPGATISTEESGSGAPVISGGSEGAQWIAVLLGIAAAVVVLRLLYALYERLRGQQKQETATHSYSDQRQTISGRPGQRRRSLLRPRDPRLAVRFYYAKFLRECRRRGMTLSPSHTSEELAEKSAEYFPGGDTAQLRELYVSARYCQSEAVSPDMADRAASCWRSLKRTKYQELAKQNYS